MRCDAMRCDAMRCDAMRCDAMRCDAMRCDAMRCDAMQCNAMQCNAMRRTCLVDEIQHELLEVIDPPRCKANVTGVASGDPLARHAPSTVQADQVVSTDLNALGFSVTGWIVDVRVGKLALELKGWGHAMAWMISKLLLGVPSTRLYIT